MTPLRARLARWSAPLALTAAALASLATSPVRWRVQAARPRETVTLTRDRPVFQRTFRVTLNPAGVVQSEFAQFTGTLAWAATVRDAPGTRAQLRARVLRVNGDADATPAVTYTTGSGAAPTAVGSTGRACVAHEPCSVDLRLSVERVDQGGGAVDLEWTFASEAAMNGESTPPGAALAIGDGA